MKDLIKNLANLLKVKTILTLVMVISTVVFIAEGTGLPDWFVALTSSVVTYYFTKREVSDGVI